MKRPTTRTLAAATLITGLGLGGTGVAMAATSPATPDTATRAQGKEAPGTEQDEASESEDGQDQEQSFTGTIAAPQDTAEAEGAEVPDAQEAAALQPLATTTAQEATDAALAAVPGTAGPAQLEDENGYVVYGVQVAQTDGTDVDVKVDAGNGTVLSQQADDDAETNDD